MNISVGTVTHFYDKLSVVVIEVKNQPIRRGDHLLFQTKTHEFMQTVESMQLEHQKIEEAFPGTVVAIQTDQPVEVGANVYLTT